MFLFCNVAISCTDDPCCLLKAPIVPKPKGKAKAKSKAAAKPESKPKATPKVKAASSKPKAARKTKGVEEEAKEGQVSEEEKETPKKRPAASISPSSLSRKLTFSSDSHGCCRLALFIGAGIGFIYFNSFRRAGSL